MVLRICFSSSNWNGMQGTGGGGAPTYGAEKCSLFWWVFVFLETLKNTAP